MVVQKDQIEDLGKEVDILPIAWRPKAMRVGENVVSYFNPKTEEFMKVQADSEQPDSGAMFGPEFLLWIPNAQRFATFFMSSKTSRRQAPELRALLGRGATLKVQFIETSRYSWHGPVVVPCSTPFTNVPPITELKRQQDVFNNPEESSLEFEPDKLEADSKPSRAR